MKFENYEFFNAIRNVTGANKTPSIEEGSHYSIPIQITFADEWVQEQRDSSYKQMAIGYLPQSESSNRVVLDDPREEASQLTWDTFMDNVAFPEKSIPRAARMISDSTGPTMAQYCNPDWTAEDIKEAIAVTLQDTVLCGTQESLTGDDDGQESEY